MSHSVHSPVIEQTQAWLSEFVIAHNICPFAKREFLRNTIRYVVNITGDAEQWLIELANECQRLDTDASVETTLLIYPEGLEDFDAYLDFLSLAQGFVESMGYEGVYQIASFHPRYQFAEVEEGDPSHFTNRSPFPMLHLLREASLEHALAHYPNPESIFERNIALLQAPHSKALIDCQKHLKA